MGHRTSVQAFSPLRQREQVQEALNMVGLRHSARLQWVNNGCHTAAARNLTCTKQPTSSFLMSPPVASAEDVRRLFEIIQRLKTQFWTRLHRSLSGRGRAVADGYNVLRDGHNVVLIM